MRAEIFTLCEYAQVGADGKLNIIGTFDTWFSATLPVVIPQLSVAVRLRFEEIEAGNKQLRFNVIDADGRSIVPAIQVPIQITMPPGASTATFPFGGIIQQLSLPRYGEYSVQLAVDGNSVGPIPLYVRQLPTQGQAQLPGV